MINATRLTVKAHSTSGTIALLPTLITDTPQHKRSAIDAVVTAIAEKMSDIIGIHLEGPHLSVTRKGAHDANLIRAMTDEYLSLLLDATDRMANVVATVAPESVNDDRIKTLTDAGIIMSLGHTDADFETCMRAFDAGARCVTHLFNAMIQMSNREPGLVGTALALGDVHAGLIADGIHVHPVTIRLALAASKNNEGIFLVTDAMATAGSDIDKFTLNDRDVLRKDHRLTLADGTLAGADLDMPRAIKLMAEQVGDTAEQAVHRARQSRLRCYENP